MCFDCDELQCDHISKKEMEVTCSCLTSLALLASLSFGAHFARNSLSIYALYMIEDGLITPEGMGFMLSFCSLPAIFLPIVTGLFVDKQSTRNWIMWTSLVLALMGQVFFLIAVSIRWYFWILVALFIFGSGTATITATQRSMVAIYFPEKEAVSMGLCISMASLAKVIGKISVVPTVVSEQYLIKNLHTEMF